MAIERIKEIRKKMDEKGIDDFAIFKDENIYYLTGFYGKDSNSILLISGNKQYLLVNFIFLEDALEKTKSGSIEVIRYKKDNKKELIDIAKDTGIKKIHFESGAVSYSDYKALKKFSENKDLELVDTEGLIEEMRVIKDTNELNSIKKACKITDKVFDRLISMDLKDLRVFTEKSLAIEMQRISADLGSGLKSFDFVIAKDSASSLPHYVPGNKKISKGILLMDFGYKYDNYCSDMTRTVFIGKTEILKKLKDIYEIVLQAQIKGVENCREGITCGELDKVVRGVIEEKGYGSKFGHSLGHGVGLEVHENPYLARKNDTILKENMVVTIEPGIYIEGLGGVRIEDMVIVKKDSCRNLYRSTKDLVII